MAPNRLFTITTVLVLIVLTLTPRIFDLDTFTAPDENRWLANTTGFTEKLARGKWDQLLQQPHPGITTQWLGATMVRFPSWTLRKLPLILGQSVLVLIIAYIFGRRWGKATGFLLGALLAFNPVLVAHTRVYAMDSLLALFLLLSLGALFLWQKTHATRYLVLAAFAGAAAILSKLPGVIILPFTVLMFAWWSWKQKAIRPIFIWLIAFTLSCSLIFPTLALHPLSTLGDFAEFFRSGDYQELHQAGPWYYIGSLIFFSTPLQMLALVIIITRWVALRGVQAATGPAAIFVLFAALFVLEMTLGAKKGDRYILPAFLALDAAAALMFAKVITHPLRRPASFIVPSVIFLLLAWQALDIARLHPYTLSYVNPLTKPWFGERRLGWGEGLDLAAAYLNQKPDAKNLKVAAYYPTQFSEKFVGETVPAHQWSDSGADYIVLYRAMLQRGPEAWETDVLNQFVNKQPEHIVTLNGLPYGWIYAKP